MSRRVFIAGVGITRFAKPRDERDYDELGREAATKALLDAGINYDDIQQAFVGYCYGDSTCGQRALYGLGMTGIPVYNVNNNCSTGSSAVFLARQMVRAGLSDCVLALGFEKMEPGSLGSKFEDRVNPLERTLQLISDTVGIGPGPFAAQIFGAGAQEYTEKYEATWEHVAAIAAKNHQHSVHNPYSQFRNSMTTEEVLKDRKVTGGLTRAMCCPTSDGGAAAVICSEDYIKKHGLENQAVEIVGMATATDTTHLYEDKSMIELTGSDMTRISTKQALKEAGVSINDIKVIECHDCFAANELLLYDSLGLCEPGKAHEIVVRNDNTYGGKWVVNPSGGLESKGHPLGATGIAMIWYLVQQLRGWSGAMQVKELVPAEDGSSNASPYALAHNLGLGGSCVVSVLRRPEFYRPGGADGRTRLGYNHGAECRDATEEDEAKVRSKKAYSHFARANL